MKQEDKYFSWLPSAIVMGLFLLFAELVISRWLTREVIAVIQLTILVFWAVITGFHKHWSDFQFWRSVVCFLILHAIAVWMLMKIGIDLDFHTNFQMSVIVGIAEAVIIGFAIAVILGGENFLDEFD